MGVGMGVSRTETSREQGASGQRGAGAERKCMLSQAELPHKPVGLSRKSLWCRHLAFPFSFLQIELRMLFSVQLLAEGSFLSWEDNNSNPAF